MASFGLLPNELVESVVKHLQDRKIDSFDIVANRDLQSVRLVCKTVRKISMLTTYRLAQAKKYTANLDTVSASRSCHA